MPKVLQQCDGCGCEKSIRHTQSNVLNNLRVDLVMKVGCNPECGPCKDCKYPEYNN